MYIIFTIHIEAQILDLEHMQKKHALVLCEKLALKGIRFIPVKNHIIFFCINEEVRTVTIARILYGRRDWVNLL